MYAANSISAIFSGVKALGSGLRMALDMNPSGLPPEVVDVADKIARRSPVSIVDVIESLAWLRPAAFQYRDEWDAWIVRMHADGTIDKLLDEALANLRFGLVEATLHNTAATLGYYDLRRLTVDPTMPAMPSIPTVAQPARVSADVLVAIMGTR